MAQMKIYNLCNLCNLWFIFYWGYKFRADKDDVIYFFLKAFLNSVVLENLMDDFARFSFGEKQFMIIDMELKK